MVAVDGAVGNLAYIRRSLEMEMEENTGMVTLVHNAVRSAWVQAVMKSNALAMRESYNSWQLSGSCDLSLP